MLVKVLSRLMKKVIAVDIDDVIADSTETLRIIVNTRTGANLESGHYKVPMGSYWGYYERIWRSHDVDITYRELEEEMEIDQSHVPLLSGASFAIGELSSKYDIVIITSRPPEWEPKTKDWLMTNFGDVFVSLHFTQQGEEKKTKGQICKDLGVDYLIDDNPEHCQSALGEGVEAILFGDYGWHHKAPKGLVKCEDWQSVLEYFNAKS